MGKRKNKNKKKVFNANLNGITNDFKKVGTDISDIYKRYIKNQYNIKINKKLPEFTNRRANAKIVACVLITISILLLLLTKVGIPIALILLFITVYILIEDK